MVVETTAIENLANIVADNCVDLARMQSLLNGVVKEQFDFQHRVGRYRLPNYLLALAPDLACAARCFKILDLDRLAEAMMHI